MKSFKDIVKIEEGLVGLTRKELNRLVTDGVNVEVNLIKMAGPKKSWTPEIKKHIENIRSITKFLDDLNKKLDKYIKNKLCQHQQTQIKKRLKR
jgi:hypothetical protein